MSLLNGGQALIHSLQRAGIRTVFGIPGAGQYEAVDALYDAPGIRYISVRHEQAATYMADGYARASGEIAAALLAPGPGLYNGMAGMATAYAASAPMLVITGARQPSTDARDSDELAVMRRLTKWSAAASQPAQIPELVREAVRQLKSGRPRPVGLEIAPRILAQQAEVTLLDAPAVAAAADLPAIQRAAPMLRAAQKPVLWAGGGVQRAAAWESLQRLAEHLQMPVVTSRQGKGVLSDRHPLALGMAELRYAPLHHWLAERDLIVAVGTSQPLAGFAQPVVRIDADIAQFADQPNGVQIAGDAAAVLQALLTEIANRCAPRAVDAALHAEIRQLNGARFAPANQLQPQMGFMQAIRNALPADGLLVQGMNQMGYYSRNYFPVYAPRAYLTASAHATLGCAWPLALGAKVAQPERAVVALSGDGGFLYNAQELATAVQQSINAVVIVFNDNAYGNVLRAQQEEFDGRVIGTRLHNPDFLKLAESYGVRGVLAADAAQLETALRKALVADAPTLIEVKVGELARVY
ncbi:MAG: thiamine pyrophosphate-binding protein [Caldilineaceae bacterium]